MSAFAGLCLAAFLGAGVLDAAHFLFTSHCLAGNGELIHAAHHDHEGVSSSDGGTSVRGRSCPACEGGLHRCEAGHYTNPRAPALAAAPAPRPAPHRPAASPRPDSAAVATEERLYLLFPKHSPPSPR